MGRASSRTDGPRRAPHLCERVLCPEARDRLYEDEARLHYWRCAATIRYVYALRYCSASGQRDEARLMRPARFRYAEKRERTARFHLERERSRLSRHGRSMYYDAEGLILSPAAPGCWVRRVLLLDVRQTEHGLVLAAARCHRKFLIGLS